MDGSMVLEVVALLVTVSMVGVEGAVSALINPPLARTEPAARAVVQPVFARRMGAVMPFWYGGGLLLLLALALLHRNGTEAGLLWWAVGMWALAVLFSLTLLVPINNRIARAAVSGPYPGMTEDQRVWDRRHAWRVGMLVVAVVYLMVGLLR